MTQEVITTEQFHALQKPVRAANRAKHDYKADFLQQLAMSNFPLPAAEVYFARPRRWRFDWAYVLQKIAIEYEGGIYLQRNEDGRRHQTTTGFEGDCRKYNEAAIRGWTLIRITAGMVRSGEAIGFVERALQAMGAMKGE